MCRGELKPQTDMRTQSGPKLSFKSLTVVHDDVKGRSMFQNVQYFMELDQCLKYIAVEYSLYK